MSEFGAVLADFKVIRPRYEGTQQDGIEWLSAAHATAEATAQKGKEPFDRDRFSRQVKKAISRYGCRPDKIEMRGSELSDFLHTKWDEMRVFRLEEDPHGVGMEERNKFYAAAVDSAFERFYPEGSEPPDDLIHVTCTGYISPSGAQRIVEKRGWHRSTTVSHAYHMGCYASVPALRMAVGFLASSGLSDGRMTGSKQRVDIVHSELCTLHLNPSVHTPEQLVVQSLFADGFIRYSALAKARFMASPRPGLEVVAVREEILPDSMAAMTWLLSDWGMEMGLSRDVPARIARSLDEYLEALFSQAGLEVDREQAAAHFAVHPGGPKIIEKVQDLLGLADSQVRFSREVLFRCGNMSSATLPHIWNGIAESDAVPSGTLIVSLAFGPGLTIGGCLMRKTS